MIDENLWFLAGLSVGIALGCAVAFFYTDGLQYRIMQYLRRKFHPEIPAYKPLKWGDMLRKYSSENGFYDAIERGQIAWGTEEYDCFYTPTRHALYLLRGVKGSTLDTERLARIEGLLRWANDHMRLGWTDVETVDSIEEGMKVLQGGKP